MTETAESARFARRVQPVSLPNGDVEPISSFIGSNRLKLCDILLFRRKGSFFARNLTSLTGDFYAHSAVVFATPATDPGFTKTYVIECGFGGVDIKPLEVFLRRGSGYMIAVKRFEPEWFSEEIRRAVRGHALNYIKADYSFRTLTDLFLRAEAHVLFNRRQTGTERARALEQSLRRGHKLPRAFICSGFVQYGFFEGIQRSTEFGAQSVAQDAFEACYFAESRRTRSLDADLLSVTPQDMADSEKLSWKYALWQGQVCSVQNAEAAQSFFTALR